LKLVPEGVPDASRGSDVIKGILRSLGSIGNDLAQLALPGFQWVCSV
jgi:hypothetical protein